MNKLSPKIPHTGYGKQATALGISYAMGTFNDNFFKQAALLSAVTAGNNLFQSRATLFFALPFVLFSTWSGWLADRFPKKNLVVWAKIIEVAAMLVGAWAMIMLNWNCLLAVIFCMGLNSTLFSPSLNGSIPELFPENHVPQVNAIFKLVTTAAILLGIALAGSALDQHWVRTVRPFGQWLVAGIAIFVAMAGLTSTLLIAKRPGVRSSNPFPWSGPAAAFIHLWETRQDPPLLLTLFAEAFFYFLSTLVILVINNLGARELGLSYAMTSALSVALMVGICVGSLLAARGTPQAWRRLLVPAALGIGLTLCAIRAVVQIPDDYRILWLLTWYAACGLCGGLYLIPVTSFIQVRPRSTDKGRILGISNCLSFTGILLAGQSFLLISAQSPSFAHIELGLCAFIAAALFFFSLRRIKKIPEKEPYPTAQPHVSSNNGSSLTPKKKNSMLLAIGLRLLKWILKLRYSIHVQGLGTLKAQENQNRPILFLPNHPALMDPVILYSVLGPDFHPRPLADSRQVERPLIRGLVRLLHPIVMPDLRHDGLSAEAGVRAAIAEVINALRHGDHVLFYPSGALTRTGKENLGGNSGVRQLLDAVPETRVVLVRTTGLWGSSFSWAQGVAPDLVRELVKGLGWIILNVFFFMPRRDVYISLYEEKTLGSQERQSLNRTLESFYNKNPEQAKSVSRHFLLRAKPLPALSTSGPGCSSRQVSGKDVPESIRTMVFQHLQEESSVSGITDTTNLSSDLGFDSLEITALASWIEEQTGHRVERLDLLNTAEDCILAAIGMLEQEQNTIEVPEAWFPDEQAQTSLELPQGTSIPQIILEQAQHMPHRLILAERTGTLSYKNLVLKAFALASYIRRTTGTGQSFVGIMLPASPAAALMWLAAQLAGKTPVMLNWTTGMHNFTFAVRLMGLTHIFTSKKLVQRLERQGTVFEIPGVELVFLEDTTTLLTKSDMLKALLKTGISQIPGLTSFILPHDMPETAAVLFTSGSESEPKAVPLTHANILANCRDIAQVLSLDSKDRMLAMLPPFHSLGLTGNIILPLVFGVPMVCHPNPTEGALLAELAQAYRTTLLVSPPSFLEGMLQKAAPGALRTFRLGFVGAEKCPEHVYSAFAKESGAVLCEGYGVTECSPVVSVNNPSKPQPGTIGFPLPSVAIAVVMEPENPGAPRKRVAPGETGMLLVRGPNVFNGYYGAAQQPFIEFEGHSWYRTGDLVCMDTDGCLTFQGRLKRFVKIGGEMVSLPQIESVLTAAFEPKRDDTPEEERKGPALAVESTESVTSLEDTPRIVLFTTLSITRDQANKALRTAGLSGLFSISEVRQLSALPLLGTGKIDYRTLQKSLATKQPAG